ncbi:YjbH domain-containing protein [Emticicia sp. BO119]|uniref:YjbH domain-containing protein n=1 Tax=Emticicia sp. BO119 TaxID=2757768 RepID=UPI0015F07FA4|nr:YjbH domain-containing protein [Emticicia sp. BO119]MBA4850537.1 YjbH domain-containing protein [Emticicia sp. BO119]
MKKFISCIVCFYIIIDISCAQKEKKAQAFLKYEYVVKDSIKVSYEQRVYRNPYNGFVELRYALSDTTEQKYIPLFQGVPFVSYQKKSKTLVGELLTEQSQKKFGIRQWFPFKEYKVDFSLLPQFTAKFGNFDNPVEAKINLLLNTQLYLGRGLALTTGIAFPLINDLDKQSMRLRLAPTFLNKFLVFQRANFMSLSAGLFYKDQYGINMQYRYFDVNKHWSFGLEGSYTGYYRISGDYFEYQKPEHILLLGDISYRIYKHDLTLKLSGGQYLYEDRGIRFDFIRQFTNVEIGFYVLKTMNGTSVGFNFAVPIPPGSILKSKHFHWRTADEFRWEYLYVKGYNMGERYRTGYQLDEKLRMYHSNYWKNQLRNNY